jgi:hypothetical protein
MKHNIDGQVYVGQEQHDPNFGWCGRNQGEEAIHLQKGVE